MEVVEKFIQFIKNDISGRLTSFILGVIAMSVMYQNFILVEKDTQLHSKEQLINVKEERIKSINDQINVLKVQLSYKPFKDKKEVEDLTAQNKELSEENEKLISLVTELKSISQNTVSENLVEDFAKLKKSNLELEKRLATYTSKYIVEKEDIPLGRSWNGFDGVVVFGVENLTVTGAGDIRFSVNGKTEAKRVYPGDQFQFTLGENQYLLNVVAVEYVSSKITVSISKKYNNPL
ncbi:hypothetical protein [Marinomonas aquiplantarum]|nr:hypothetical protein [Marinomonas aquiplantarum]